MGILYLNEHDIVQYDATPTGSEARNATSNRHMLGMISALEQMIGEVGIVREIIGKPDPDVPATLAELSEMRSQILARAQ